MFRRFFSKEKSVQPEPQHPYMTETVIFANQKTEFVNPTKKIRKTIVNERGRFVKFPGIENVKLVLSQMDTNWSDIPGVVSYRTEFNYQNNGLHFVLWEVQPDGWYWADEGGFGAEDDDEVRLYSYLNEDGNFTAPFRIYNVANNKYFGTDQEEKWRESQE